MKQGKLKFVNNKIDGIFISKINAFTLIELLAIIVILAVIAVITVPIILNVIDNSKRGAAVDSAYGYRDAINKYYLSKLMNDVDYEALDGEYEIAIYKNDRLTVSGEEPSEGWVKVENSAVTDYSFKIGEYVVTYNSSNDSIEVVKGGSVSLTPAMIAIQNAKDKASEYVDSFKTVKGNVTGIFNLPVEGVTSEYVTGGWVALIEGEIIGYSLQVGEYVVTFNNDNQFAQKSTIIASSSSAEEAIIAYYSEIVATKVSNYVAALLADTTIQGYTKDTGKKVSEISTPTAPTGIDSDSWVYFAYNENATGNKISAPDYSLKFTEGGYTFVVNSVSGTVSDPVYNGNITTPQKKPASFADDSWTDIKTNLTANRNFYPIGSTKIIEFDRDNDGINEYYKLRLVNTESCLSSTAVSKTSCGVVIEFVTTIGEYQMNSVQTNEGGWKESAMRSYLNTDSGSVFSMLPSDLQSVIIPTAPIVSGSGKVVVSNDVVATTGFDGDKLFLLSPRELGLIDVTYDNKNAATDTNILSYYNSNNNNDARKKYDTTTSAGVDGYASRYWLRSAWCQYNSHFHLVYSDGTDSYSSATGRFYVGPAFRILD